MTTDQGVGVSNTSTRIVLFTKWQGSGLHGYGTELYPRSLDELESDVLSALEENGYGETTETIEGETFDDMEEAISYIKDVVLVELDEVSKDLVADLDSSISDVKQELEELKDKRKKTFLFINKFSGSI